VDDSEVIHDPDAHVVRFESGDRRRAGNLRQESCTVDEGAVGRYEGQPLEALRALMKPFVTAKWMADPYSAMLGQEVLADFITSGHFERYLRRACTRNAARRRVLIAALQHHLRDRIEIAGENAGVHLLVWLEDVAPRDVATIVDRAARAGVGVYPISPCYSRAPRRAGFLFGYASMTESEIRTGVRRFAEVVTTRSN
jgi:GntR family transcriptional regulator/MocR family aminotransferase